VLQAQKPFSQKSKEYIAALDVDRDQETLAAHGLQLRPECNRVRKVTYLHCIVGQMNCRTAACHKPDVLNVLWENGQRFQEVQMCVWELCVF